MQKEMDRKKPLLFTRMINTKRAEEGRKDTEDMERQKCETPRFYVPEGHLGQQWTKIQFKPSTRPKSCQIEIGKHFQAKQEYDDLESTELNFK